MKKVPPQIQRKIEELIEKEGIFQYFLNELNVGFCIVKIKVPVPIDLPEDEQIKMIYEHAYVEDCNDALAKMYGFSSPEAFRGKKLFELNGGPDVAENIEAYRNFIRNGYRVIRLETLEVDKEGNKKWFRNNVVGIIKNRALVAIMRTRTVITKMKEMEHSLKKSEEEKELILNSVTELIILQDRDLKIKWANKSAADSLGLDYSALTGRHCYELWHKRDSVCENCPVDRAIKTGEFHSNEMRSPDGRDWFIKAYPVKDENGEVLGAIEIVTEITEKVRMEERIELQQKFFEGIFEFSPLAMVMTDKHGKIFRVNPEFERLFGWKEDEIKGIFLDDMVIEPERKEEALSITNRVAERESIIVEGIRIKKDRSPVYVTVIGHPIVLNDEVIAQMAIYRDITAQKKMEEQLIQSAKMEAIGKLAGGIAHDFNNLLTVISGNAELLISKFSSESPDFKKIKQIIHSSRRAIELTKQLLTISKRGISEPVVLNLNNVIEDMKELLRRLIGEDVEFEFFLEPSLKNIKADRSQIEQILMNMAVNSRDAMPKGGRLTIKTENVFLDKEYCKLYPGLKEGEYICLSIADTGVGIPPEIMPKIFEPFFTTKSDGTGLGLSTVYGIVKQLEGNVTVYSNVGKGTIFHVYIPVCEEEERNDKESLKAEELPKGNETILVVEDEKQIIEYIIDVLTPLGYNVISATSRKEVLEKLKEFKGKIHLLLSDVVLPGENGPEIAKELVFLNPEIKVLFMSGYPDEKIQVSQIVEGNINFISKPFSMFALAKKIREVLDS